MILRKGKPVMVQSEDGDWRAYGILTSTSVETDVEHTATMTDERSGERFRTTGFWSPADRPLDMQVAAPMPEAVVL